MGDKLFYVYEYIRLDTNEPFYIGKGKGKRCFEHKKRNSYFLNILKHTSVAVSILHDNLTEDEALGVECYYIDYYRTVFGYNLCNKTFGGEGGSTISLLSKSEYDSFIEKKKLCSSGKNNPMYGHVWGEKHPMLGKKHSKESIEKMRATKLSRNKKLSEDEKEHLRQINLGSNNSNAYNYKITYPNKDVEYITSRREVINAIFNKLHIEVSLSWLKKWINKTYIPSSNNKIDKLINIKIISMGRKTL